MVNSTTNPAINLMGAAYSYKEALLILKNLTNVDSTEPTQWILNQARAAVGNLVTNLQQIKNISNVTHESNQTGSELPQALSIVWDKMKSFNTTNREEALTAIKRVYIGLTIQASVTVAFTQVIAANATLTAMQKLLNHFTTLSMNRRVQFYKQGVSYVLKAMIVGKFLDCDNLDCLERKNAMGLALLTQSKKNLSNYAVVFAKLKSMV